MQDVIGDFWSEVRELHGLLESCRDEAWEIITQFKDWTVNDTILHLYSSDALALASAVNPQRYLLLRQEISAKRQSLSMIEETRARLPHLFGQRLLDAWVSQAAELRDALRKRDPKDRLEWVGPPMSVSMMAIARQMETWAHGQAICDILGIARDTQDRIRNIAEIGVRTFKWSFSNRGLTVPQAPRVELFGPSGQHWLWNEENGVAGEISGSAIEFCWVVTQARNVADTALIVRGETAEHWMQIAQCFAGPAVDPPLPGQRFPLC